MVTPARAMGLGVVGLAGDRVYDVLNHGGPDQAVYAYAREDLDFWAGELGRPLGNGVFGENLTTAGGDVNAALIGERWRVGTDADPGGVLSAHSVRHLPGLDGAGRLDQAVYPGRPGPGRTSG